MEVFSDELRLQNSDLYPDRISPFPSSFDSILVGTESRVSTPDIIPFPPQKLRPIRCNAKSLVNFADTEMSSLLGRGQFGDVSAESSQWVGFGEVGFASNLMEERLEVGGGFGDVSVGDSEVRAAFDMEDVELDARVGEDEMEEQNHPAYSSASSSESEGNHNHIENAQDVCIIKRKRTGKKLEGFMQKFLSRVLLNQEMMHHQLMEMMEKKEKERSMREEAWKQEEMERVKRDELVREHKTAQDLALISLIQNILGNDVQLESSLQMYNPSKDKVRVCHQKDMVYDGTDEKFPTSHKYDSPVSKCLPPQAISLRTGNRRWLKGEVQALIQICGSMKSNFHDTGSKCSVWDEVSARLLGMGYHRPAMKCKEKWENINKHFKRIQTSGIKKHQKSKACPYFEELSILYHQGDISRLCDPNDMNCAE